jgi:UDP-N-acetylmuramoyl-tripeptide--D-alanyl-D-alanine ligase
MITAKELATALRPALIRAPSVGPLKFRHAVVDSRKARRGDIFFALKGERADGHDFVVEAAQRGATGAVLNRAVDADIAQYVVPDPLRALQSLAWQRRNDRPKVKVIAVTGSVGKTTTKELTAALLATRYNTLRSEGNLNSEIGLPLMMLDLTQRHRRAVLEMGMWAPGEISFLCDIAQPEVGIVTNVGPAHLERMGSIEAIAKEKGDLPAALPDDGVAVLNADDPIVAAMAERTNAHVITYGLTAAADVRADNIRSHGLAGMHFDLVHGDEREPVDLRLPGRALISNALAAAAAAIVDEMELDEIAMALSESRIVTRLSSHPGVHGAIIVDDTYNASPASMHAALDLLGEVPGRKFAVLGDMRELGDAEADGHRAVGRHAAEVADVIYAVGDLGRWIGDAAIAAGHGAVHVVADKSEIAPSIAAELRSGDVVLLKASRALELETVANELREDT